MPSCLAAAIVATLFSLFIVAQASAAARLPPVGVGISVGNVRQHEDYELIVEGTVHLGQRKTGWGIYQYGFNQSRLELGKNFGITTAALSGVEIIGLRGNQKIAPHFGAEPFSVRASLGTDADRKNYYGWLPMGALGIQAAVSACKVLPQVRGGAAVGTMTKSGILPYLRGAYGAGLLLNCEKFDVGSQALVVSAQPVPLRLLEVEMSIALPLQNYRLGMRVESLSISQESRGMVLIRGPLPPL